MEEITCPQCKNVLKGASVRIVQDTCGHKKCRLCLLQDEEKCKQCIQNTTSTESVIRYENNHTAVITCNNLKHTSDNTNNEIETINKLCNKTDDNFIKPFIKKKTTQTENNKEKKTDDIILKRTYKSLIVPNHIAILKDSSLFKCNICNKTFSTRSHIKYHVYCNGGNKPYHCNECAKQFITKSHLEVHMLTHAGTKPYICNVCKKSFNLKSKLNRHELLHSSIKRYICQECGKAFKTKDSVRIHLLIHNSEKPFSCKKCDAKFSNSSNLKKHLVSHSKNEEDKKYMCDQCGKRFKLKWTLTVHQRSHLLIRPHECSNCHKKFVNAKDLHRHQLKYIDVKAYTCGICQTGFKRKDNFERHMKNTHPGQKVEPIKKSVKPLLKKVQNGLPVDTPNAIKVITASPSSNINNKLPVKTETRTVPVINAPLKLAFKTTAFKSHYNIHRDYIPPKNYTKQYDLEESVNIYQKILSPHNPPTSKNIIKNSCNKNDVKDSTEICQKILSSCNNTQPLHYETSFEHKTHSVIKNIKFKLPSKYTNLTTKTNELLNDIKPLKPVTNDVKINENDGNKKIYHELKTVSNITNAATSVIVNTNHQQSEMHWRRRTSLNFNLQSKN